MSDNSLDGDRDGPPRKATPWSVRKIVEQVTGRPLESMQDPPGTRRNRPTPSAPRDPPLERYHEESGPVVTVLAEPAPVEPEPVMDASDPPRARAIPLDDLPSERTPSLRAFLPGTPPPTASGRPSRPAALPISRTLPKEVVEEVERLRAEEGNPMPKTLEGPHSPRHGEVERVYLSYLLMHLDKLTEPALKYLRHAVEEECEERGLSR